MAQKHLQHRVPREDEARHCKMRDVLGREVRAPRINLTWRWIAAGTARRMAA